MDKINSYRIEVGAAQALAEWKALFAEQVAINAKELSKISGSTGIITLEHYRLAASIAVQKLAMAVQGGDPEDDHQENA